MINNNTAINPIKRIQFIRVFFIFSLSILCIRLWFLQVLYGSYYRDKSENNRIRTVKLVAPRGRIIDRNGYLLVGNRPSYNLGLMIEDVENPEESIVKVSKIANIDPGLLFDNNTKNKKSRRFEPRIIMEDISLEQFTKLKANSYQLQGITFETYPTRVYPYDSAASQVFGYVREITKQQIEEFGFENYKIGDVIGQTGLEKNFEHILRGKSGYMQLEVDAKGVKKQELGKIEAIPGKDIKLSIDIDLQKVAEKSLGEYRGAVIALNPNNGEILTLASLPTYNANIFSGLLNVKEWEEISKNSSRPMTNRAMSHTYPLGSTSKLLWSIAGLSENVIQENTSINCPGFYRLGNRKYLCNKVSGHGLLDLKMALTVSCNAYYYNLGQMLGIERMSKYMNIFGFGAKTGIDLLGEESGIAPSPDWKLRRFKEKWYPGDSVPISIGQGYFVATPLQLAQMGMIISNLGKLYKIHVIKSHSVDNLNREMVEVEPELVKDIVKEYSINEDNIKRIREISASVTEHERGTAKRARIPGIRIGGKTGTAQVVRRGLENTNKLRKDHAWFIGYAPVDNPSIVVVAIVENSGHGGEFAAPVVRDVMYAYFDKLGMINKSLEEKVYSGNKQATKAIPTEEDFTNQDETDVVEEEIEFSEPVTEFEETDNNN